MFVAFLVSLLFAARLRLTRLDVKCAFLARVIMIFSWKLFFSLITKIIFDSNDHLEYKLEMPPYIANFIHSYGKDTRSTLVEIFLPPPPERKTSRESVRSGSILDSRNRCS